MKKSRQLQMRRRRRLLIIWSLFGLIGVLWMISAAVSWLAGAFKEEDAVKSDGGTIYAENIHATESSYGELTGEVLPNKEGQPEESESGESGEGIQLLPSEASVTAEECLELYEEYEELLVLVNGEQELEEGAYEDTLRSICNGRLQASDYLYDDLVDLLAAAGKDGHQYWIASAYRSRERQQELVDEDVDRYTEQGMGYREALEKTYEQTMPAGKSEHETGLALDILCSENVNMDISQAEEPGNQWLAAHAHEYGFILRYPADKEDITGILYEPWHFRYVGKEAANFLYENNLTLEEFYEFLEKEG